MAADSKIEWCDATFNPWWGCERVSPACAHCYADTLATRYGFGDTWGSEHGFRFFGDKHWDEPLKWARTLPAKLGRRPRVFCASMADVFEERDELAPHRHRLFELTAATPELDWLLLTKRPTAARDFLFEIDTQSGIAGNWITRDDDYFGWGCLANVWVGVSIENARFTWRADVLREIPAAVRFISAEPLLGSLYPKGNSNGSDQPHHRGSVDGRSGEGGSGDRGRQGTPGSDARVDQEGRGRAPLSLDGIDWVIIGGESGPKARPFHLEHARELIEACDTEAGHPLPAVFVKQLGAKPVTHAYGPEPVGLGLRDRKGGDVGEWPADLRIREFPRSAVHA